MKTAKQVNLHDGKPGRKVWFQFWDTLITNEFSYYTRLKYVHFNPIHHGIVEDASDYKWCSAKWFLRTATGNILDRVMESIFDKIKVYDQF